MTRNDNALAEALQDAHREILDLRFRLAEYEWVEDALRKRTLELSERVKELECLYAISRCLCRSEANLPKMLQDIADILPRGYQHPKRTWVHLEVAGKSVFSASFQTAPDSHGADIIIHGRRAGKVRVYVLAHPGSDEPPILAMERALLQTVVLWIGKTTEHWREPDLGSATTGWWVRTLKRALALIRF